MIPNIYSYFCGKRAQDFAIWRFIIVNRPCVEAELTDKIFNGYPHKRPERV
jgi:hypothetical protein